MHFEAMELKICEGCGSLWVRCAALMNVYCGPCAGKFAQFPRANAERRSGRKRKVHYAIQGGVQ